MRSKFKVLSTPCFDRELQKIYKRDKKIADMLEKVAEILAEDSFNHSGKYDIKKLVDVKQGDGQWRIRLGAYRFRYDIFGKQTVLHSVKDRKDVYK